MFLVTNNNVRDDSGCDWEVHGLVTRDGCKHGKVDQKNVLVSQKHSFFSQTPKSSSKVLLKLNIFPW